MKDHKTVYHALISSQQEFGQVRKGSVNPAFKSKYADLADVASVVIPTLSDNGVAVLHYPTTVGDMKCMRTEFYHADSGTKVWCDIELIVDKDNMQGMKSPRPTPSASVSKACPASRQRTMTATWRRSIRRRLSTLNRRSLPLPKLRS